MKDALEEHKQVINQINISLPTMTNRKRELDKLKLYLNKLVEKVK